jgi:hypothetical protein
MNRAHKVDAINTQLFYFRRFMAPPDMSDPDIARVVERATADVPSHVPVAVPSCHGCSLETPPESPRHSDEVPESVGKV